MWIHALFVNPIVAVLHNVLDSSDSVTVSGGKFTVNMNGPPKVYSPVPANIADTQQQDVIVKQVGELDSATTPTSSFDANDANQDRREFTVQQGITIWYHQDYLWGESLLKQIIIISIKDKSYKVMKVKSWFVTSTLSFLTKQSGWLIIQISNLYTL